MDANKLKNILEAGLLVAGRTLSIAQLEALFQQDEEKPERKQIREALEALKKDYNGRGIELVEVASGYRLQSHESVSDWVANLFQEKTPRYSRALLETLVLIAYRQPITRAEIEDVRGVAVSSNIIKTLQERQWVKVLGHKEVPGRPALLGTTKDFLDYFNLKKLDELPSLADIKDLDQFDELLAEEVGQAGEADNESADEAGTDEAEGSDSAQPDGTAGETFNGTGSTNGAAGINVSSTNSSASPSNSESSTSELNDEEAGGAEGDNGAEDEQGQPDSDEHRGNDSGSAKLHMQSGFVTEEALTTEQATEPDSNDLSEGESDSDIEQDANEEDVDPNETLSGPELELLRVISDFSDEHQQEVDARDQMEAGIVSKDDQIEEANVADLSQRIGDDRNSGDLPEPGDTLH